MISLLLVLVSVNFVSSSDCKSKFDLSLYMMPFDQSLYLEARNDIILAEKLSIDCGLNIQKQFLVKKHLSFLNSHVVFRAFIGISETTSVNCIVFIKDSQCEVSNDDYILPSQIYIPINNTQLDPKVSLLETNDTRNGFYKWIDDELLKDLDCENDVEQMRKKSKSKPKI